MTRKIMLALASLPALVGVALWALDLDLGLLGSLFHAYTLALAIAIGLWLLTHGLRRFLWRVGRRLAFSYFLIGVLPIPLMLILVLVATYICSGFFLGHIYRDALASVGNDLRFAAHRHLEQITSGTIELIDHPIPIDFAYYRDGRKLTGAASAPDAWLPGWHAESLDDLSSELESLSIVAGPDGAPTLAAMVREGPYGILATFTGDLSRELSERSGIWVELLSADDALDADTMTITLAHREYPLRPPRPDTSPEDLKEFFHLGVEQPSFLDLQYLTWVEVSEPYLELTTGKPASKYVSATLTANARGLYYHLISRTSKVNLFVYLLFIGIAFLLLDIAVVATFMALMMIFGLSRAVNHLSDATERVQQGDFSARIEVHRSDQVGALQTTFNQMATNLEDLVASAAQKEILEKEISIARELQESLLPDTLAAPASLRFAAHFEPSAEIGGDYYDLLPMSDGRLGVVMADVSGHGFSAGLRMAMVKSALALLCEEETRPERILERLHQLLRERLQSSENGRGFVTATLAVVDESTGVLQVTNAGHPPTYLLRGGEVTEIVLPSTPLGALGSDYSQSTVQLESGDLVVWLSDGLIEATDLRQEDFGYERVLRVLTGLDTDPAAVRDRLLQAIADHTGGGAPADDRTLLVMAYRPAEEAAAQDPSSSPSSA
ncbi:MAG: SpoIIE family protein phosphatase [bacterium]|nr:SpoIIE family protein phosphatase [bacterium]